MITISLCMIVKNEELVLRRCLDSVCDLVDEVVIVDTGSTDMTKAIAKEYTDKVYDFKWVDDFSEARNYSFSKCTMDYIYVADADEYLTQENREQFRLLKENMYPEIEIVQMMYETISNDTVLNIYREYRPKLYKRLREFVWIDPIHETVRIEPLVFDSDIVVTHAPAENHASRDFSLFKKALERDGGLSENVSHMYATELYKCGSADDFVTAIPFFESINSIDDSYVKAYSTAVLSRGYRIVSDFSDKDFESYVYAALESGIDHVSEIYFELGEYYLAIENYELASNYFYMAAYESTPIIDVHAGGDHALRKLIDSSKKNGDIDMLDKYIIDLENWSVPVEGR